MFPTRLSRIILICTVGILAFWGTTQAQQSFRDLRVDRLGFAAPGYLLIAPDAYDSLAFVDHTGSRLRRTSSGIISTLQAYGDTSLTHFVAIGSTKQFIRRNSNLATTDTLRLSGSYPVDFHEGKMWTDSTYIILGHDDRVVDMSKEVTGGRSDAVVRGAVIQERTLDGVVLFEWKSLDHIPVSDATEDVDRLQQKIDYIHVNSINRDANGDLVISCRHLDEVICVSRSTGNVLWRFGGVRSIGNQFSIIGDSIPGFKGFSHQHTALITSRGTLMMFDNGNLKPAPRTSRVVEYALDVPGRKATKVWEYLPVPRVFSASMGSVQELVNGNVLVGFGLITEPAVSPLVSQEVNRSGQVVAEVNDNTGAALASYRVLKTTMGMYGSYKLVSTPSEVMFSDADSTSNLSMNFKRVAKPTGVIVERHSYAPKLITFVGNPHCGTLPMRWVVRFEDAQSLTGQMTFDVGSMGNVENPDQIRLLYRPLEGQAGFAPLEGGYVQNQRVIVLPMLLQGEFMLAYKDCFDPTPVSPANNAVEVSTTPKLAWKVAALADSYEVQLATNVDFTKPLLTLTTRRVDTTLPALANATTFFWRVRKVHTKGPGPWSAPYSFTTQIGLCTALSPVLVGKDTIAIQQGHVFRWTRAQGASSYRLTISDVALEQPIVDVTTTADTFNVGTRLTPNTHYTWVVRGINGTTLGRATPRIFLVTAPDRVALRKPANDAAIPFAASTLFEWEAVPGALRYAMLVRSAKDSAVLYRDTVVSTWVRVNSLPRNTPMLWQCRAIGRYGSGPLSDRFEFTLVYDNPLGRSIPLAPRGNDQPYGDVETVFTWSSVQDALRYRLQVFDRQSSAIAVVDTVVDGLRHIASGFAPATSYDWRVMAVNDRVSGKWSDTARFITRAEPSAIGLLPVFPGMDAEDVATSGEWRFTTSDRYARYEVELGWDESFRPVLSTFVSDGGNIPYSDLMEGARYFWRAVGIAPDSTRTIGAYSVFTTVMPVVGVESESSSQPIDVSSADQNLIVRGQLPHGTYCAVYDLLGSLIVTIPLESGSLLQKIKPPYKGVVFVVITTPQDEPLWKGAVYIGR